MPNEILTTKAQQKEFRERAKLAMSALIKELGAESVQIGNIIQPEFSGRRELSFRVRLRFPEDK